MHAARRPLNRLPLLRTGGQLRRGQRHRPMLRNDRLRSCMRPQCHGDNYRQSSDRGGRPEPAPPRVAGAFGGFTSHSRQDSALQSFARLDCRILLHSGVQQSIPLFARRILIVILLLHVAHPCLLILCASFSFSICRARNTRERTAASLIPKVSPTSRGDISSRADRTSGSRSFAGSAAINLSRTALICVTSTVSSAAFLEEAISGIAFSGSSRPIQRIHRCPSPPTDA